MIIDTDAAIEPQYINQDVLDIGFFYQSDLLQFAFMTVLIEVPLFYICGYRKLKDCVYFTAVNIMTNLLLNEFLGTIGYDNYWTIVCICEVFVVLLEFALCSYWLNTDNKKLFKVITFTNFVSFLAGVIYYIVL
ncbi:MAG: hypothetical protein IJ563_10870 [Selenomonadaceae bacterium]|nr:hypothetical protein [Selenomonadaceae bacterium]